MLNGVEASEEPGPFLYVKQHFYAAFIRYRGNGTALYPRVRMSSHDSRWVRCCRMQLSRHLDLARHRVVSHISATRMNRSVYHVLEEASAGVFIQYRYSLPTC